MLPIRAAAVIRQSRAVSLGSLWRCQFSALDVMRSITLTAPEAADAIVLISSLNWPRLTAVYDRNQDHSAYVPDHGAARARTVSLGNHPLPEGYLLRC